MRVPVQDLVWRIDGTCSTGFGSDTLVGDVEVGASPRAVALDAGLALQLEPFRGDAI